MWCRWRQFTVEVMVGPGVVAPAPTKSNVIIPTSESPNTARPLRITQHESGGISERFLRIYFTPTLPHP